MTVLKTGVKPNLTNEEWKSGSFNPSHPQTVFWKSHLFKINHLILNGRVVTGVKCAVQRSAWMKATNYIILDTRNGS